MSLDFWLDLLLAVCVFAAFMLALPQVRMRLLQRLKARVLRPKLAATLQRLLGLMAQSVEPIEVALEARSNVLQSAVSDFQAFKPQEIALYSDEQASLERFRVKLFSMLPYIKAGGPRTRELEDLILLGQRIVSDLRENTAKR